MVFPELYFSCLPVNSHGTSSFLLNGFRSPVCPNYKRVTVKFVNANKKALKYQGSQLKNILYVQFSNKKNKFHLNKRPTLLQDHAYNRKATTWFSPLWFRLFQQKEGHALSLHNSFLTVFPSFVTKNDWQTIWTHVPGGCSPGRYMHKHTHSAEHWEWACRFPFFVSSPYATGSECNHPTC